MNNILSKSVALALPALIAFPISNASAADNLVQRGTQAPYTQPAPAQAEPESNWTFITGLGTGFAPAYEGSDKTKISVLPIINAEYKDGLFFIGKKGIGITPLKFEDGSVDLALGYDIGRKEKDDRKNLKGMGKIDSSATATVSADYNVGPVILGASVTSGMGGDYGTEADLSIGTNHPITEKLSISSDAHTTWSSDDHMKNYFGVSNTQATASGKKAFKAESGIKSYGVGVGANYQVSEKWTIMSGVKYDNLIGDAADSPVSKKDGQLSGFVGAGYRF